MLRTQLWEARAAPSLKQRAANVDDDRVFPLAAPRGRRTGLIATTIFASTICLWLGPAAPARATVTSLSVGNAGLAENTLFSGTVATFTTDDPFDTFSYIIDWGDGTANSGPASISGSNGSVSGAHTYAEEGTYTLTVTVIESGGSPGTRSSTASVTVGEADASLTAIAPTTLSEGTAFSGPVAYLVDSGSFDPAANFTATIDWGDGTTTAGTISGAGGNFTISGSHVYADERSHGIIQVSVSEPQTNTTIGPAQDQINVTEADILTGHPLTLAASDAVPFSGTVATFSDTSSTTPASDFSATVSWGDGTTTSGTVSLAGGTLTVSGSHTYNSPPGGYPVTVQLADDAPGTATASAASTGLVSASKPSAATQGAGALTINSGIANATVNPNGAATSYFFQYGTTTAYGSSTRTATAGSGNSARTVSASLSGLAPASTYHYRVLATNAQGATVGVDQTFTTPALVASLKGRHDGSFMVVVNAPGSGTIDVVVMAGKNVYGDAHLRAGRAGRVKVLVRPNRTSRGLRKHRGHPVSLRFTVTFTPHHGRVTRVTLRASLSPG